MKTLLLNGCSYADAYRNIGDLASRLGLKSSVNLGRPGGSNSRSFRTTLEYLSKNQDTGFVVLMLTFWGRFEAPWCEHLPVEGKWISYSPHGLSPLRSNLRPTQSLSHDVSDINSYIKHRVSTGGWLSDYLDRTVIDVIMFSGWLDSMKIPYCIFHTTGLNYDIDYQREEFDKEKYQWIKNNPRIIDLDWSSNQFMHDCGGRGYKEDQELDPRTRHYHINEHNILTDFLYNYIIDNNLLTHV